MLGTVDKELRMVCAHLKRVKSQHFRDEGDAEITNTFQTAKILEDEKDIYRHRTRNSGLSLGETGVHG